jgi:dTDP-4-dehydrorhamnose reductase
MPTHIIIGNGKLGQSLARQLKSVGESVHILSQSNGYFWPNPVGIKPILDKSPDVVWCTVGAGSVVECAQNYNKALDIHVGLPVALMTQLPDTCGLVLCSTNYVASPDDNTNPNAIEMKPPSLYAMSKWTMEQHFCLLSRRNTVCVRFGDLYSITHPHQSFPGKAIMESKRSKIASISENLCTPTPVEWLAKYMIEHLIEMMTFTPKRVHIAPQGSVSFLEWSKLFLTTKTTIIGRGIDPMRPANSMIGCSLGSTPNWRDLWNVYGSQFKILAEKVFEQSEVK